MPLNLPEIVKKCFILLERRRKYIKSITVKIKIIKHQRHDHEATINHYYLLSVLRYCYC
jgi:hypothetical protein